MAEENGPIRIPNLPIGQIADSNGMPTDDELTFRQGLITSLQKYMGSEGLVMPTQSSENLTLIQDNKQVTNLNPLVENYTCLLGTLIYVIVDPDDYTQDKVMVAVRADNTYPATAPVFKEIQLI